ncbi:uncharacterized protein LOC125722027 [Brienomyrus brachyistius]|uniref:uncharacterized protein LOC125722027 n=1 Tax=Brienomyrus brachyistius TaxID=42636 RepID=UPI0020B3C442|nr:uncharacterized protein LOC125722027 [Brienomyrus brachyistius]
MDGSASEMRPPAGCNRKSPESVLMERADSPVPSCVSLKSDASMDPPLTFREGPFPTDQSVLMKRADSPVPSCVSLKSDASMEPPITFREGPFPTNERDQMEDCSSDLHDKSGLSSILKSLEEKAMKFLKEELETFVRHLDQNYPECSEPQLEEDNDLDCDGQMQKTSVREVALKITLYILRTMKQDDLADLLDKRQLMLQEIKAKLKKQFECVFEGKAKEGQPTLLSEIYTELYITEGGTGAVNDEHEVRQIETASKKRRTEDTTAKCNDIFKPLCGRETPIRTVLTKGVAGIGKTVSVQKFILDWAEGKANQDVHFIFALPFRDLNLIKGEYSLTELLHHFVPELKSFQSTELFSYKVLFIFDGLEECRFPLDFQNNESWFDVTKKTSLDVLLTNLIKRRSLEKKVPRSDGGASKEALSPLLAPFLEEMKNFVSEQVNSLNGTLQQHHSELRADLNSLRADFKSIQKEVASVKSVTDRHSRELADFNKGLLSLDVKITEIEDRSRRLNLKPAIDHAHRLHGRSETSSRPPPILMHFMDFRDRQAVVREARKVQDLSFEGGRIFFFQDFSAKTAAARKAMNAPIRRAKELGLSPFLIFPARLKLSFGSQQVMSATPEDANTAMDHFQSLGTLPV